jgi:peptidoglycan/LPS O-acetylase OafA/YrhL
VALGGVLPMSALAHWSNGSAQDRQLLLNAVTDTLILAGLVLAVSSRSWAARAGTTLAALVALALVTFNQSYPYPWSGCVILALMFTGTLIYRAEQGQISRTVTAAVAAGVLALVTIAGIWHGAQQHENHHWQLQWATSVLLAGGTFGLGLLMRRWKLPRWCAWLGMISYSVYLLHPIVFDAYRSIPVVHRKYTLPEQVLVFAVLLALIIGLSALTYYLVERPMQRLGRRVASWAGYAAGTGSGTRASAPDAGAGADGDGTGGGDEAPAAASRSASSSTAVAGGSGASP